MRLPLHCDTSDVRLHLSFVEFRGRVPTTYDVENLEVPLMNDDSRYLGRKIVLTTI